MAINLNFISTNAVVRECSTLQLKCIIIIINCISDSLTASNVIRYSFEIEVQVHGLHSFSEALSLIGVD